MWEHRSVSNRQFEETGRTQPTETYVKLMDQVEAVVSEAQTDKFDAENFMSYIPRKGPWEEIPASDHSLADARLGTLALQRQNYSTPTSSSDPVGLTPTDSNSNAVLRTLLTF